MLSTMGWARRTRGRISGEFFRNLLPIFLGGCWTKISERWDWRPFYPGMNHATDTPSCVRWRPSPLEREGIGAGLISDPSHTFRESGYGMGTTAMAFLAGMEISFENNSTSLRPRYRLNALVVGLESKDEWCHSIVVQHMSR